MSGHTGGQVLYDAMMTAAVKGRLAHGEGLRTLTGVQVRTDNDVILLTGHIPDAATGHRIDALVRNVAGHHRVKNELMIESEAIAAAEC